MCVTEVNICALVDGVSCEIYCKAVLSDRGNFVGPHYIRDWSPSEISDIFVTKSTLSF